MMTDAPDWEGFGRDLLEGWPVGDVDGMELFEAALRNGMIREILGGYDPEQHIDAECICPEAGDPWYEYAFPHTRAAAPAEAALAAAYRMGLEDAAQSLEPRNAVDDWTDFARQHHADAISIRALPVPTPAEILAQVAAQEGEG